MASTLLKSSLPTVEQVWVADPDPSNVPGDFSGGGGGGGAIGVPPPDGISTILFDPNAPSSWGSEPAGFPPPNISPVDGGDGGDGGDSDSNWVLVPGNGPGQPDHYVNIPELPPDTSGVEL
jgi:hypothetical protein